MSTVRALRSAVRSCPIGMRLADELAVDAAARSALYDALPSKDAGVSPNAVTTCSLFRGDGPRFERDSRLGGWTRSSDTLPPGVAPRRAARARREAASRRRRRGRP